MNMSKPVLPHGKPTIETLEPKNLSCVLGFCSLMDPLAIESFLTYWLVQATTAGYHFLDPSHVKKLEFLMQKIEAEDTEGGKDEGSRSLESDSNFRTSALARGMGHVSVSEENSQSVLDVLSSRLMESSACDLSFAETETSTRRLNNRTYHLSSHLTSADYINHIVACGGRKIDGGMKTIANFVQQYYVPEIVCHIEAMATGPSRFDVKVIPSNYIDPVNGRNPSARNSETVYIQMWDQTHLAIPQSVFMNVDWLRTGMQLARTNCQALWSRALHVKMGSSSVFDAAEFKNLSEFLQYYKREVWFILYMYLYASMCSGALCVDQLISFRNMFMQAANLIACYYGYAAPFSKELKTFVFNEHYELPNANRIGYDYFVSHYKDMRRFLTDLNTSGCFPFAIGDALDESAEKSESPSDAQIATMLAKEAELLSDSKIFTMTKERYSSLAESILEAAQEWHKNSYNFA